MTPCVMVLPGATRMRALVMAQGGAADWDRVANRQRKRTRSMLCISRSIAEHCGCRVSELLAIRATESDKTCHEKWQDPTRKILPVSWAARRSERDDRYISPGPGRRPAAAVSLRFGDFSCK